MLVNFAHVFPLFAVLVIGGRSKNTEREIYPAANHEEDWRRVEGFEFLRSKTIIPIYIYFFQSNVWPIQNQPSSAGLRIAC